MYSVVTLRTKIANSKPTQVDDLSDRVIDNKQTAISATLQTQKNP
jgi:hypothetical protein